MKRTSLMLPNSLRTRAIQQANQLGISLGEFIRKAMEAMLRSSGFSHQKDPLLADTNTYAKTAVRNLSVNHDEELYGRND